MDLINKKCVITGAASGIGLALAHKFSEAGADLVIADRATELLESVATILENNRSGSVHAFTVNLSTEQGNIDLINFARQKLGSVDLFFANAGVGIGTDVFTPEAEWNEAFAINFHAHRWALKELLPGWLERRDGYFCSTASAAGLLTQLGNAPYSVTKHAALAFAEWVSISYGDSGIKVSCLCPQGVNTPMINGPEAIDATAVKAVRSGGNVMEPDEVADIVVQAIRDETFLILPHTEVQIYTERKATDHKRWLAGMRKLQAKLRS